MVNEEWEKGIEQAKEILKLGHKVAPWSVNMAMIVIAIDRRFKDVESKLESLLPRS